MKKFELAAFVEIAGIGATSGLVYINNLLYIVSDNSTFLYQYTISENRLFKIKLFENSQESIVKKDKADFEVLTFFDNKLYLFGSGSTKNRNRRVAYSIENKALKEKDLSKIYKRLTNKISITACELNIEGVIITPEITYFFQRGNSVNALNGIFCYERMTKNVVFNLITLPKINEIEATFTDAILIEETIYFLAAAENTNSAYDDGEIMGSFIGTINLNTLKLIDCIQISDKNKFEGLTLYKKTATEIELLLCEDDDKEQFISTIYLLKLFSEN